MYTEYKLYNVQCTMYIVQYTINICSKTRPHPYVIPGDAPSCADTWMFAWEKRNVLLNPPTTIDPR